MSTEEPKTLATVYGPVRSWRFGHSLGIDLIVETSTCSFNCIYCQLGQIQRVTSEQRTFVSTERVKADLAKVKWETVDLVTISGSGEPTLALNIEEVIAHIKDTYHKPVTVLTNATWLHDQATRRRLWRADTVACKLDAADEETLQKLNRPAKDVTLQRIVEGIKAMKADGFPGVLAIQSMFMPMNVQGAKQLARLIQEIAPDELHLNTPKRPYPKGWYLGSRGNHEGPSPFETASLKTITLEEAREVEQVIREENTGLRILSVYTEAPH